jgi:predicted Na+-dependent transporter
LARPQRLTLALKAGVQNISIALGIAIGVLGRLDVAAVAALYGITQLLVATAYALSCRRSRAVSAGQA